MNDDAIKQRIAGRGVRAVAKAQRTTVTEINEAINRWTDSTINRQDTPVHPCARVGAALSLEGDVQCGTLVTKILGDARFADAAVRAALQIVDEARPKGTSIDRIERVLAGRRREGGRPGHSLIAAGRVTAFAQRPTPSAAG